MFKKIVFMGTPDFSVPIMKSLYQNGYPICTVYTQPPNKSKRGQKSNKSPVQKIAENFNLNIRNPNFLSQNEEELKYFKSLSADIVIVVAYGQLIPKEFLMVRLWCVPMHKRLTLSNQTTICCLAKILALTVSHNWKFMLMM